MNTLMVAQINGISLGQLCIYVVVAAAVVALMYVALKQFGIAIPAWVIQCFWIIVVAIVVIAAIRFVLTL